jgi:hypothetical protein
MRMFVLLRLAGVAAAGLLAAPTLPALAQSVVRIGMTAADIPRTLGQPDQGFEGNRFTGNTMYEGLTTWDLSSAEKASVVIPGVAAEWSVSPTTRPRIASSSPGRELPPQGPLSTPMRWSGTSRRCQAGRAAFRPEPGRRHRLTHAEPT